MSTIAPKTRSFDEFLSRALCDAETRAAFEDSQARHRLVDTLVRLRNRIGLTQTDVAKEMGVKQPSISGFETEGSDPRLSTLQRYARAVDAFLWVEAVPNAPWVRRNMYAEYNGWRTSSAQHEQPTERATAWASQPTRYQRHGLSVVPEPIPA